MSGPGRQYETDKFESGYVPLYIERIHDPIRMLEVGVMKGGSLQLWCDLWPTLERVVGVDLVLPSVDLPAKVSMQLADQRDPRRLREIAEQHGPFDLVIDDASHEGSASWATFSVLWPQVGPGGIYVVEDWATGYWGHWPDGVEYQPGPPPGHTAGMVGMIKRLVDEVGFGDLGRLEVLPNIAFAYKA